MGFIQALDYDFAPTILDVLEIDYEPRFPFGESLFGDKAGQTPTVADMQFIDEMIFGKNSKATCRGRPGVCDQDHH
jgi:phosphoglycerol transferase MdoB-like AlkP superfamily enzyme